MIAAVCQHDLYRKNGVTKSGAERYRCSLCGKSWTEGTKAFDGMRLGLDRSTKIIHLLCEGMSIRATGRLTNTDPRTIIDLLLMFGAKCEDMMRERIKGVHVGDVQVDEIWSYIFCKRATAQQLKYVGGVGDAYCYTAIERNTKLLVAWHLGRRDEDNTALFVKKLRHATIGRFHLSSDGWPAYPMAVWRNLGGRVDYGVLVKIFREAGQEDRRKYSPSQIIGSKRQTMIGNADPDLICTSHAERMNGTIRTFCKRMNRLTYCFSKRWASHNASLSMCFGYYNYCHKHRTLKGLTPAMSHGLEVKPWPIAEFVDRVLKS